MYLFYQRGSGRFGTTRCRSSFWRRYLSMGLPGGWAGRDIFKNRRNRGHAPEMVKVRKRVYNADAAKMRSVSIHLILRCGKMSFYLTALATGTVFFKQRWYLLYRWEIFKIPDITIDGSWYKFGWCLLQQQCLHQSFTVWFSICRRRLSPEEWQVL